MSAHKPRKRFGQHFLHEEQIIYEIIATLAPSTQDTVVEIGPGTGALTQHLLKRCQQLHLLELDRDLVQALQQRYADQPHVHIHQGDALRFDFADLGQQDLRIIGNLPYNISTPLLFHLFNYHERIRDMLFMLQQEVVQRLVASPGSKHYGRLSVMTQFYCQADLVLHVPPDAFDPPPQVDSAVVYLRPRPSRPEVDSEQLELLVSHAFAQRRKTLGNTLAKLLSKPQITACGIDPSQRAEQLNLDEFVRLTHAYTQQD